MRFYFFSIWKGKIDYMFAVSLINWGDHPRMWISTQTILVKQVIWNFTEWFPEIWKVHIMDCRILLSMVTSSVIWVCCRRDTRGMFTALLSWNLLRLVVWEGDAKITFPLEMITMGHIPAGANRSVVTHARDCSDFFPAECTDKQWTGNNIKEVLIRVHLADLVWHILWGRKGYDGSPTVHLAQPVITTGLLRNVIIAYFSHSKLKYWSGPK